MTNNIAHEVVEVYYLNVALALFNTGGLLFYFTSFLIVLTLDPCSYG